MIESQAGDPVRSDQNWQKIRTALVERITRRWKALVRLSPDSLDTDIIQSRLATVGDDADALIRLFDDVERRLDQVFARQSHRPALTASASASDRRRPDPIEFKSE